MRLRPSVLSIDDDPGFQATLKSVLNRFGLNFKAVADPKEFLEAAEAHVPELVLIDLQLEGANGVDLVRSIRTLRGSDVAVLVISGSNDSKVVLQCLEAGADDFLQKPLDRTFLATKLSRYLETSELSEQASEWQALSQEHFRAKLSLEVTMLEVDEFGVTMASNSLLPKGVVLRVSAEFFQSLGIKTNGHLVTVMTNAFDQSTGIYTYYAEFEEPTADFLQGIRSWLGSS
jgi:CheY-like chemotaxis protein